MAISTSQNPSDLDPEARAEEPRILAVDDSSANLAALEIALGDLGGRIVNASSGRDALRLLLEQEFAVMLLDVKMPGLDGFETARIVRERERTRHLPIIFLTAHERDDRQVQEAYSLGAVDFLFKPLVPEVLRAKVSVFVELQQRTLEVRRQGEMLREMERRHQEGRIEEERRRWETERLREESRRKDEFLAMLAHELRNPLSPMVTGIEILKRMQLPEQAQGVCGSMERQVHHLIRLVDDLLDISRISRGKIEIKYQPLDLVPAVRQGVEGVRAAIENRGQTLVEDLVEEPLPVRGDRSRLVQLVSNLLTNANRYTADGGRIEITLRRDEADAVLEVSDDGCGIRPEMRDRIFEMFVQEREDGKGLGLGLTLVKRIVQLHDGRIGVESEGLGKGASFTVHLPLAEQELVTLESPVEGSDPGQTSGPLVVVVIEDEADVREATRLLLESWGHEVHAAASGAEGLELVRQHRPRLCLVDIGMPGMDGYQVARRIRERGDDDTPYLVAVTGYGQERDRRRAKRAGFDSHLVKPATAAALGRMLLEAEHGASEEADRG